MEPAVLALRCIQKLLSCTLRKNKIVASALVKEGAVEFCVKGKKTNNKAATVCLLFRPHMWDVGCGNMHAYRLHLVPAGRNI